MSGFAKPPQTSFAKPLGGLQIPAAFSLEHWFGSGVLVGSGAASPADFLGASDATFEGGGETSSFEVSGARAGAAGDPHDAQTRATENVVAAKPNRISTIPILHCTWR